MPQVVFTSHLRQFLKTPETTVDATTVREALDVVFGRNPGLRSYILDDQDRLRNHVVVFVDGKQIEDRRRLSDLASDQSEIYVLQALSGG